MRYPEEVIEEVRQKSDILDVVGSYVKLKKKGTAYFGLCPFHNEKSPSFSVSPEKQMYYCFGCGAGGNVFTFVMQYENFSFTEALEHLAAQAGVELPRQEEEGQRAARDRKQALLDMYRLAAGAYYKQLHSPAGEKGMAYLSGRGLTQETIRSFGLGYAPAGGVGLYKLLREKGYTDEQIKESGLVTLSEKGTFDKFWNRVMFPIPDVHNKVIAFGGRVMGEGEPKYLNSPETLIFEKSRNLYGLHVARQSRVPYMLICEGYMDVIALHQAGFTNAVAALGTAFTLQHGLLLKRYVKEVILTFDSDGAGIKAALRAIPILKEGGLEIKVLSLSPYKDPDEFLKNESQEAFKERIEQAENSFLFEVRVASGQYDMQDPAQKTGFYREIAKKLLQFPDELERNTYMEAVCSAYRIDYGSMKKMVAGEGNRSFSGQYSRPKSTRNASRSRGSEGANGVEQLLLTWMAEEPRIYPAISHLIQPESFSDPVYREVARLLMEQLEKGQPDPGAIIQHFVEEEDAYSRAAAAFSGKVKGEDGEMLAVSAIAPEDKQRVLRETVLRVRRSALEAQSRTVTDMAQLQQIILQIKNLENEKIVLD